jgi:hypothetical protein
MSRREQGRRDPSLSGCFSLSDTRDPWIAIVSRLAGEEKPFSHCERSEAIESRDVALDGFVTSLLAMTMKPFYPL